MTVSYEKSATFDTRGKLLGGSILISLLSLMLPIYDIDIAGLKQTTTLYDFLLEDVLIWSSYLILIGFLGVSFYKSRDSESIWKINAVGLVAAASVAMLANAGRVTGNKDLAGFGSVSFSYGFFAFLAGIFLYAASTFFRKSK